jgi:hypothetical protein
MRRPAVLLALLLVPRHAWTQGDPLGPEFRVNTYTTGDEGLPSVAADGAGNFVVAWTQDPGVPDVVGQRYSAPGTPVGGEFRINTYATSFQSHPSVAVDGVGGFVVAWQSLGQDGVDLGIFAQRFSMSGLPLGPEFRVNSYITGAQRDPAVVADTNGNFVVVWASDLQDGSSWGVFGQRYASSGAPQGPEFRVNSFTTGLQVYPAVAATASGEFVVVWQSYGQDDLQSFDVFGQRYAAAGAPVGPEFRVNTYSTANQQRPSVAVDPAGGFVVAWDGFTGAGGYDVFGRRYAASGSPLGPEWLVNSYVSGDQARPSIARDGSGNIVVVWSSDGEDGSGSGVFGQRYAADGSALGQEFRANSYTSGAQYFPSAASGGAGDFVVVWHSDGQDGQGYGVFGQRYGPIVPVELMHIRVE